MTAQYLTLPVHYRLAPPALLPWHFAIPWKLMAKEFKFWVHSLICVFRVYR